MSNIASWWPTMFSEQPPSWLQTQTADRWIFWIALAGLLASFAPWSRIRALTNNSTPSNYGGGRGGNVTISGATRALGFGGRGGGRGPGGQGGLGGDVNIRGGDYALGVGGEQGEAGQEGRGGRGGRSGLNRLRELGLWNDFDHINALVMLFRSDYAAIHKNQIGDPGHLDRWINERLNHLGISYVYRTTDGGHMLERIDP